MRRSRIELVHTTLWLLCAVFNAVALIQDPSAWFNALCLGLSIGVLICTLNPRKERSP